MSELVGGGCGGIAVAVDVGVRMGIEDDEDGVCVEMEVERYIACAHIQSV